MKKKLLKIISMFVLAVFISREIFSIGSTWSFFSDVEVFQNNIFQAGTLDIEVTSPTDNFVSNHEEDGGSNASGYWVSREAEVSDSGDVPFKYTVKTWDFSGNEEFCQGLNIMAMLEGNSEYVGSLSDFSISDVELGKLSDKWLFDVYSENRRSLHANCEFKLIFEAKQKNESDSEYETGFTDEEEIANSLNSGMPHDREDEDEDDEDENEDEDENDDDNRGCKNGRSVGYLNGEIEVIIDDETGDILEIVGEGEVGLEGKEDDPEAQDAEKDRDEGGFVEARDIFEEASSYHAN